jgi:lipoate-protein ligase A
MIKTDALSGALNMALDEVLLQSVQAGISPPVVRLYRWQPKTVTLGYGQRGARQVNTAYCRDENIDIVRRLTGGRAVLHDQEVTYSVISRQQGFFSVDILDNYRTIAEVLLHCLKRFELDAEIVGRPAATTSLDAVVQSACFTAPAQLEIVCSGKKICGSSQKRERGSFLQHGSIPVDMDLRQLFCALNTDNAASVEQGAALLGTKVGWVNQFRQSPCTVDEVEMQLMSSFSLLWPVSFCIESPTEDEMEQACQLARQKYDNTDWHLMELT